MPFKCSTRANSSSALECQVLIFFHEIVTEVKQYQKRKEILKTYLPGRIFPLFLWRLVSLALLAALEMMEDAVLFLVLLMK